MLKKLVRDYYALATSKRRGERHGLPADAKDDLRKATLVLEALPRDGGEPESVTRAG